MTKISIYSFVLLLTIVVGCKNESSKSCSTCGKNNLHLLDSLESVEKQKDSVQETSLLQQNLIDIQKVNSRIQVDLKYASTDNFMHIQLYSELKKAFLQKDVAERLGKCQDFLTKLNPAFHLLVYDAVRPVSTQQKMWDALDTLPFSERTKFVSNPANGSIHNYGAAVDLTICDAEGKPLDMGAGYDDIREIAYPRLESKFLESGELTQEQVENRKLLRKVMATQGFSVIETEWWHFNACSRKEAKKKYAILENE